MSSVSGVGTISSAGVGSGLDVETIVSKLVAIESQPITNLQTAASKLETKLSSWGQIKSKLATLSDAAEKLTLPSTWSATSASSSDATSVAATSSTSATAGSYSVNVSSLASAQTLASAVQSSSTATLGSGTLTIELGTWSTDLSSFSAKSGASAINVSISSTDTLSDIRDKINSATDDVSASIVTDASGSRLVLRGNTGASNGFRITTDDDDGTDTNASGLSALAYNPAASVTSMSRTQAAANAAATINGLSVSSESNTITAIDGLTLTLSKVTASPVNVTVAQDNASITKSINDFVSAYNSVQSYLATQTKYDATSKKAGALQGDTSAVSLQTQLRSMVGAVSGASSTFGHLSDLGVQIQKDGSLSVNSTTLTSALGNLSEVKKAFSNLDTSNDSNNGFARKLMRFADDALGVDGTITTRSSGIQKTIDNNEKRQEELQQRIDAYETRLRAQYTALDEQMASLNTMNSYISKLISSTYSSDS